MSTTIAPKALPDSVPAAHVVSAKWGMAAPQVFVVAGFCLFFLYHNYLPLFHSDLWGHVAYGDWILTHGRLPQEDPFTELAAGVPLTATAWLSQVLLALAGRGTDPERLAHVFAAIGLASYLILARTYFLQTRWLTLSAAGTFAAFLVTWSRHAVQRPENFGLFCLAVLLWCVIRSDRRDRADSWRWPVSIGLTLALWANLHGSFIVGIAVLVCWVTGRAIDAALLSGRLLAFFRDATFWRRLWCLEFALLGSCFNPYGFDLLLQTLVFPTHPNLNSVLEWFPLEMKSLEGLPMALSWVMTGVVLRLSQRRMSAVEVLWLLVLNAAVCLRVRMIAWYGPIWILALLPHVAEILSRAADSPALTSWQTRFAAWTQPSIHWTAVTVLLVWMTFAFAPISRPVLGGTPRRADQVFSHETPLKVTRYLHDHPPSGLVFAPQWWGDWLTWRGPSEIRVMMTTNAIHLAPPQVWQDYLTISMAEPGWEQRLDRYRINTVVASVELQPELCRSLEQSPDWRIEFEDAVGIVARRKVLKSVALRGSP
ncbi:MAG: hypothetical protein SFV23_20525 [Planctomycetaceae bacterium]|nr:hypothetical protein [Planctomycetaceae bacterium]